MVAGPLGEILAVCDDDGAEEVVLADLKAEHAADIRGRIPIRTDCRPSTFYADALLRK